MTSVSTIEVPTAIPEEPAKTTPGSFWGRVIKPPMLYSSARLVRDFFCVALAGFAVLQTAGCDIAEDPGAESKTFELRIARTEDGSPIYSASLAASMVVDPADFSSTSKAAFKANGLSYEGRRDLPFDGRDLLLNLYVEDDGSAALFPSLSGGGGFLCGFPGDDVLEDFAGTIFAFSFGAVRREGTMRTTLPYRALWVDCDNDYTAVEAEYLDTIRVDPSASILPTDRLHAAAELPDAWLTVEIIASEGADRLLPIVVHQTIHDTEVTWQAALLTPSTEDPNVYRGTVRSEGPLLYLALLAVPDL